MKPLSSHDCRALARGLSEDGGGIDATVPKTYAVRVNRDVHSIYIVQHTTFYLYIKSCYH